MMILGAGLATFGFLLLLMFNQTYTELILAPIPTFVGLVMMIIAVTNIVVLSSRRGETGIQTGMAEMFQDLGASIGPVVVAAVLASFTGTFYAQVQTPAGPATVPVELPTLTAFHWLFGVGALLAATTGVLALFLRNYRFHPADAPSHTPTPGEAATAVAPVAE